MNFVTIAYDKLEAMKQQIINLKLENASLQTFRPARQSLPTLPTPNKQGEINWDFWGIKL